MKLYSRAEWGAKCGDGAGPAPVPAAEVWLHHSETRPPPVDATEFADFATMRELERIGQSRFGAGISYTFAVMPSGRVMHGHGPARQGTHTLGHNTRGRGVVLVGDYQITPPGPAMLRSLEQLLVEGAARGWWQRAGLAGGHRDVRATVCPGDQAYARIREINIAAGRLVGLHDPTAAIAHLPRVHAGETSPAVRRWQAWLIATYPDRNGYRASGYFGPRTIEGTAAFQVLAGIAGPDADGRHVGPRTLAAAYARGFRG